jgi:TonB family protein
MRRILPVLTSLIFVTGLAAAAMAQLKSNGPAPVFEPARVTSTVEAVFPPRAVNWGTVVVEVAVGATGEIENVRVVRDFPGFTEAALSAVKKWKFKPATLDGKPIRSVVPVAVSFAQPPYWRP